MVYHHKNLDDTCNFDNCRKAGYTSDIQLYCHKQPQEESFELWS